MPTRSANIYAINEALDFTAAANVPANALGEQKAFEDFLSSFHSTLDTAYDVADTRASLDQRVQNLTLKADTVFHGVDLSTYVRIGRYDLPEPTRTTPPANSLLAQEVSAGGLVHLCRRHHSDPLRCTDREAGYDNRKYWD